MHDRQDSLDELQRLRLAGSLQAARALVDAMRSQHPDDAAWSMEDAIQLLHEGHRTCAAHRFEATARAGDFAGRLECLLKGAEAWAELGEFTSALRLLADAESDFPDYEPLPRVRRGIQARAAGTGREQIARAIAALRQGGVDSESCQALVVQLREHLRHAPDDLDMLFELGRLHRRLGDNRDAVPLLRRLGSAEGEAVQLESLIELARAHAALGEAELAWRVVREIGTRFPEHAAFTVLAIELMEIQRHPADALRLAEQAFGRLAPRSRSEALEAMTRAMARRHLDALPQRRTIPIGVAAPRQDRPVLPNAGILMLTKDESDILGHNLRHHYRLGFRHFCIVDNRSGDNTAAEVERFRREQPDSLVLYVFDQVAGHYQAEKMAVFMDAFARYARLAGVALEWLVFLDTDELIAPVTDAAADALRNAMTGVQHDIIVFHWLLGVSDAPLRSTPQTTTPFGAFPVVKPASPPTSKVAIRIGCGCRPTEGNHWVLGFEGTMDRVFVAASHDWFMFHFMIRSFEQLKSKVVNGGLAFQGTTGLDTHGGHWKARYQRYERDGDRFIEQLLHEHVASVSVGSLRMTP